MRCGLRVRKMSATRSKLNLLHFVTVWLASLAAREKSGMRTTVEREVRRRLSADLRLNSPYNSASYRKQDADRLLGKTQKTPRAR